MRIERLTVENYRVLRDVTFNNLTPLTVLCGANGSGKSTVFDVFAFLNQAFTQGLRPAWDDRRRMEAIRSRGHSGPVSFEIKYRAENSQGKEGPVTYFLAIDQVGSSPVVIDERLQWSVAPGSGRSKNILVFTMGEGQVCDEDSGETSTEKLSSPDLLAVSARSRRAFRDPDAVSGGTATSSARVLKQAGHHRNGLRKISAAEAVAPHLDVEKNDSMSFQKFRDGLRIVATGAC